MKFGSISEIIGSITHRHDYAGEELRRVQEHARVLEQTRNVQGPLSKRFAENARKGLGLDDPEKEKQRIEEIRALVNAEKKQEEQEMAA